MNAEDVAVPPSQKYLDTPEVERIARKGLFDGELTRAEIHELCVAVLTQLTINRDRAKSLKIRESRPL